MPSIKKVLNSSVTDLASQGHLNPCQDETLCLISAQDLEPGLRILFSRRFPGFRNSHTNKHLSAASWGPLLAPIGYEIAISGAEEVSPEARGFFNSADS